MILFQTYDPSLDGFVVSTILPDGSGRRELLPGLHECPVWSPNGREIGVGVPPTAGSGIVFETIVAPDGSTLRELKNTDPTILLGCPAWSHDGTLLAEEGWDPTKPGREGIYSVRATDGGGLTRITSSTRGIHDLPGAFSPDGKRIVFVHLTDAANDLGELWLVEVDTGKTQKLIDELVGLRPAFSPDGRSVIADSNGVLLIFDVASLQSPPTRVRMGPGHAFGGSWSPDGSRLLFSYVVPGTRQQDLYSSALDGTDLWRITYTDEPNHDEERGAWAMAKP